MKNTIALPKANPIAPPHPEKRQCDRFSEVLRSVFGGGAIGFRGEVQSVFGGGAIVLGWSAIGLTCELSRN